MWRLDTVASVGIERFNPQVVGEDQDDVGFLARQSPGWCPSLFFCGAGLLFLSDSSQSFMLCFELLEGVVLFGRDLAVGVGVDMGK